MSFSPKQGEGRKENSRQEEKHSLAELGESVYALKSSQSWCLLCSESLLNKSKRFHPCLQLMGSEVGIVTKGNQSEKSEISCGLALKYELDLSYLLSQEIARMFANEAIKGLISKT